MVDYKHNMNDTFLIMNEYYEESKQKVNSFKKVVKFVVTFRNLYLRIEYL